MLQMVQAWIAVKELNLLQTLTSSTGAGEEQALQTQEEKKHTVWKSAHCPTH